jgi:2-polyprenyl-3-methyl-5-hydroxy-6-metoxy-1,4-benzoquinol methylase
MTEWWRQFFDAEYVRLWGANAAGESLLSQVQGLIALLGLRPGVRILDAPCGYGRLSQPLARTGAVVLGVDQSAILLEHAERTRADVPAERLQYVRHDLRQPLAVSGFDCALNVFSSIGYGTEEDDLAILRTLR